MNTIFDFINCIAFDKRGELLESSDDEKEFNPFMLNRWLSMYSPDLAMYINETTNKYTFLHPTKREQFDFFISIIPTMKRKRIEYIKKTTNTDKDFKNVELIAKSRQSSIRETANQLRLVELLNSKNNL